MGRARSWLEAVEAVERVKQSSHDWLPTCGHPGRRHCRSAGASAIPPDSVASAGSKRLTPRDFVRQDAVAATKSGSYLFSKGRQLVCVRQTNLPLVETPASEGRQTGFGEKKTDNGGRKNDRGTRTSGSLQAPVIPNGDQIRHWRNLPSVRLSENPRDSDLFEEDP
jgi:hypothetical protein